MNVDDLPRGQRWHANDLDRCEHGRHLADPCFGCPGGWSTGNLCLREGQVIGHTLGGRPIRASGWRRQWQPDGPASPLPVDPTWAAVGGDPLDGTPWADPEAHEGNQL